MQSSIRAASTAAFLIFVAMLIHNLNGMYLEPTFLGFEEPTDYGDMTKIENALWSFSFTSSGISHMVVGFAMVFLGLGLYDIFRDFSHMASRLILVAAVMSGLGFFLTGVSDIPGTAYAGLLRDMNPEFNETILLVITLFRGIANSVAIVGLGWFAGQTSWCMLKSDLFSEPSDRWFAYLGYLNILPGIAALGLPVAGFLYLKTLPIWMIWLGLRLRKLNP
ncbi:MAG: hypothetical protein ACR2P6_03035 [Gammaproteobacteria bacterium]